MNTHKLLNTKKAGLSGLIILGLVLSQSVIMESTTVNAQTGGDVAVTATVGTILSCSAPAASVGFGTLSNGVNTASATTTTSLSCNDSGGCNLSVIHDGLVNGVADEIASATADLSSGAVAQGYGIQGVATQGAAGSGTLSIQSPYNVSAQNVGGLTSATTTPLASVTSPLASGVVDVTYKIKISALTPAGSYSDTVTYGCTGN